MGDQNASFIAGLDVGTTSIKCQIFNSDAQVVSSATTTVSLVYPQPGFVEINPDDLWRDILHVIKEALRIGNLSAHMIKCLGISTQRGTFITFRKDTGKHFHNFITWKDMRAKDLVKMWNESLTFKGFRMGAYVMYLLTRNKRFLMASGLNLTTTHCTGRLLWVLHNIPEVQENITRKNVCFATVETWLMYKLTGGKTYVSDITNASSTGLFDPFIQKWSSWPRQLMNVPTDILPEIVNSDYEFGASKEEIFGIAIPIKCLMADQHASMFGSCCFAKNDLKVTLGTGSFVDINTGGNPHGSLNGMYPLVAWKFADKATFIAEAACNDTGSLVEWALNVGLANNPTETSALAYKVTDTDGVYFVPAFSGLGPPICDNKAASGFFGLKPTSTKEHLLRSILESIVYRIVLTYGVLKKEINTNYQRMYVDGGVSKNDFVCQLLADMSGLEVVRSTTSEMSVLGVVFVAGLNSGIWKNIEELSHLRDIDKIFKPILNESLQAKYSYNLREWMEVVERFGSWY